MPMLSLRKGRRSKIKRLQVLEELGKPASRTSGCSQAGRGADGGQTRETGTPARGGWLQGRLRLFPWGSRGRSCIVMEARLAARGPLPLA